MGLNLWRMCADGDLLIREHSKISENLREYSKLFEIEKHTRGSARVDFRQEKDELCDGHFVAQHQ